MPSVFLDDDELIEMILERPEIITLAVNKLIEQRDASESQAIKVLSILQDERKKRKGQPC